MTYFVQWVYFFFMKMLSGTLHIDQLDMLPLDFVKKK